MSQDLSTNTSTSTAIVTRTENAPITIHQATTKVTANTSAVLQYVLLPNKEGEEKTEKLYEGPFEFSKSGYPPLDLSHLILYTNNNETLALLSLKPQLISHSDAVERIVRQFSLEPAHLLYLHRLCATSTGNSGLCRDLITEYRFDWTWKRGMWRVENTTYCYRVSSQTEMAIQQVFQRVQPEVSIDVAEMTQPS